ncbi:hypothetical protein [Arenibaculum pallidiluteum]|uniref:hypothetical protein n=1 Tax=Arenibaculum pallidiluteum TaxID=2812559 RepID=UPI001A9662A2|nr:hypothetical protein [Arenibaculum pallidiluteum]
MERAASPPPQAVSEDRVLALLEEQRRRHARLQERQRLMRLELARRAEELESVKAEARAAFGTDDPAALQALLDERRRRNAEAVAAFRDQLDGIERALTEVEEHTRARPDERRDRA